MDNLENGLENLETEEQTVDTQEVEKDAEQNEENIADVDEVEEQKGRDLEVAKVYASNRRAKEERLRVKEMQRENEMLKNAINQYFPGKDVYDSLDQATAHYSNKTIEEVRAERIKQQEEMQKQQEMELELETLRREKVERVMENDLKTIQKINPNVKSLEDLGSDFFNLIKSGVTAEVAYNAIQLQKKSVEITPPKEIGKVNKKQEEKEFYTQEEVDRLTDKDLDDPKIFERVRKSMTKWK